MIAFLDRRRRVRGLASPLAGRGHGRAPERFRMNRKRSSRKFRGCEYQQCRTAVSCGASPEAGAARMPATARQEREGTITRASPSMTMVLPTVQTVRITARRFSGISSATVTRATTVSPTRTGALKRRFCVM
jgi:hypothetical protein